MAPFAPTGELCTLVMILLTGTTCHPPLLLLHHLESFACNAPGVLAGAFTPASTHIYVLPGKFDYCGITVVTATDSDGNYLQDDDGNYIHEQVRSSSYELRPTAVINRLADYWINKQSADPPTRNRLATHKYTTHPPIQPIHR